MEALVEGLEILSQKNYNKEIALSKIIDYFLVSQLLRKEPCSNQNSLLEKVFAFFLYLKNIYNSYNPMWTSMLTTFEFRKC